MAVNVKTEDRSKIVETSSSHQQFTELFHLYKDRTYDFALRMLGDAHAAGDVAQDVFIRLYEHQSDHHRVADVKSWLFIVARNLCLNQIRNRGRQVPLDALEDQLAHANPALDPKQRALRLALAGLESPYREALILKVYQGFAYIEIAEILGTTVPAVRAILFKARNQLRDELNRTQAKGDSYEL